MAYFLSFLIALFLTMLNISDATFSQDISNTIQMLRTEKTTHLHFYFHDILSGKNPSAVKIVGESQPKFGDTYMIDDALTEGPEITSKVVGKAQGMYSIASQRNEVALLMVICYEFTEKEYNGSSISVLGRNPVFNDVREMPIVGGSGVFQLARGYALAHTVWFDPNTGDATVEYNVYVHHF